MWYPHQRAAEHAGAVGQGRPSTRNASTDQTAGIRAQTTDNLFGTSGFGVAIGGRKTVRSDPLATGPEMVPLSTDSAGSIEHIGAEMLDLVGADA